MTTKFGEPACPTEVLIETAESGLSQRSAILLSQIRSVGARRLVKKIGRAKDSVMGRVGQAIQISLGLTMDL